MQRLTGNKSDTRADDRHYPSNHGPLHLHTRAYSRVPGSERSQ